MSKDYYSEFKMIHHRDKIEQLKKGEYINPVFVQWDLTNKCNLNCSFCFYKIYDLSDFHVNDEMDVRNTFRILQGLKEAGVKAIEWTGGGEPLLHPCHNKIFGEAKRLGFEQALVTNGVFLDTVTMYVVKDFKWVRFSVDAASNETYEAVKGVDEYDNVIDNIKKFMKIRSHGNIIGMSFIVCRDNYKDILKFAQMAKEIGVDNVRFSLAMTEEGSKMFEDIWPEVTAEIELANSEHTDSFRVFSFSNRIYQLSKQVLSESCHYCQFVGVIAANGVVYPCCRLKDDGRFAFGNLNSRSFSDVWNSHTRKRFVDSVSKGCPFDCWMTGKNNFCNYIMKAKDEVEHVNFV